MSGDNLQESGWEKWKLVMAEVADKHQYSQDETSSCMRIFVYMLSEPAISIDLLSWVGCQFTAQKKNLR